MHTISVTIDRRCCYQHWLDGFLYIHVAYARDLHVNTCPHPPLGMPLPLFHHDLNKCVWYHLEGVGVHSEAVRVQSCRVHQHLVQSEQGLRLGGAPPIDEVTLLHQRPHLFNPLSPRA